MRTRALAWTLLLALAACEEGTPIDAGGPDIARKLIGPEGGSLQSTDTVLTVSIPAGALSASVEVTIQLTNTVPDSIGNAYRVQPNMPLGLPAAITYYYGGADYQAYPEERLVVGYATADRFEPLGDTSIDLGSKKTTASDPSLSYAYGLVVGDVDDGTSTGSGSGSSSDGSGTADSSTGGTTTTGGSSSSSGGSDSSTGDTTTGTPACGDGDPTPGELCLVEGNPVVVGMGPRAVELADLDGDGDLDLVVANSGDDALSVRAGDGAGEFGLDTPYAVGNNPADLRAAEFTGDADLDLVVCNETAGTRQPARGYRRRRLRGQVAFDVDSLPRVLAIADVDEDGLYRCPHRRQRQRRRERAGGDGAGFAAANGIPHEQRPGRGRSG
ncbi:MAG: FG-GAP-like repeat-containing protein [Nannocystaceae bacterium]